MHSLLLKEQTIFVFFFKKGDFDIIKSTVTDSLVIESTEIRSKQDVSGKLKIIQLYVTMFIIIPSWAIILART